MQTTTWTTLENMLSAKLDIDSRSLYDIDPHAPSIQESLQTHKKELNSSLGLGINCTSCWSYFIAEREKANTKLTAQEGCPSGRFWKAGTAQARRATMLQCYNGLLGKLVIEVDSNTVCKWKGETDGQGESKATATNSCRKTRLESGPESRYIEPSLVRGQTKLLYKLWAKQEVQGSLQKWHRSSVAGSACARGVRKACSMGERLRVAAALSGRNEWELKEKKEYGFHINGRTWVRMKRQS